MSAMSMCFSVWPLLETPRACSDGAANRAVPSRPGGLDQATLAKLTPRASAGRSESAAQTPMSRHQPSPSPPFLPVLVKPNLRVLVAALETEAPTANRAILLAKACHDETRVRTAG